MGPLSWYCSPSESMAGGTENLHPIEASALHARRERVFLVLAGLFLGGMLPFLFSSMAMKAVGVAAMDMIEEVRRQFREIPGLLEGKAKPDTARCVKISTEAGLHGIGEASLSGRSMAVVEAFQHLTPLLIGRDATRIEHIWRKLLAAG